MKDKSVLELAVNLAIDQAIQNAHKDYEAYLNRLDEQLNQLKREIAMIYQYEAKQ